MMTEGRQRVEAWKIWGSAVLLVAIALAIAIAKLEPPAPDHLKLAAGSEGGAYHAYGQAYRRVLAEYGVDLEVVTTAGSVDNVERLRRGEVDLALVQGGTVDGAEVADSDGEAVALQTLGSVFFEPVWLFHRAGLALDGVLDLAGQRVAIGGDGSGTRQLALDLLADNGFEGSAPDTERPTLVDLGGIQAADDLIAGRLDAAFFVADPSASWIRRLLIDPAVEVQPFRRGLAYQVRHPFLSSVVLGEGVLDLVADLPTEDLALIAAAASLAGRDDVHHALVPLVIEAMREVHSGPSTFALAGTFPSTQYVDLPMQPEAEHYIENGPGFLFRWLGYRAAATMDRWKILLLPFIPLLLLVFKAAPPIYRWRTRSKIYRWYDDLRVIDLYLLQDPDPAQLDEFQRRVDQLESEVTEVSVPLSYMDEVYNLRVHIELIDKKLSALRARQDPVS